MKKFLALIDGYKSFIVGGCAVVMGILFFVGVVTPGQVTNYAKMMSDAIGTGFVFAGAGFITIRSALNKLK